MKLITPLAFALAAAPTPAQDGHSFSVHDMLAMERISDPEASPDGRWVAYSVRSTDLEANRARTDVWMAAVDGSGERRLTTHEASDWGARWMPDGASLVFLSTRSGSPQVWRLPLGGGEARQLTDLPLGVANLQVFPDGERLLFTMDVFPDAETIEESAAREVSETEARVFESLLFRHWDQWEDGRRSHVFVWPLIENEGESEGGGGQPIDLMRGLDVDCPTRPFGGGEEIAIAPDGSEVVFAAKDVGREAAWSTDVDLWSVPADGAVAPICITPKNEAWDTAPAFSPDGRTIAYLAMARPGFEADRFRVVLLNRVDGRRRVLTEAWDRSPGGVTWTADGTALLATAGDIGQRSLFSIDAATGVASRLVDWGWNGSPTQAGERVVFGQDSLMSPVELFSVALDGGALAPVTRLNAERVASARMGEFEQFSFPGWNDETVYGYVMRPADYEEGRKYPVALLIHGGPQGSFGNHFHYRWNPQAYAGAGYAPLFIDFHGSTGYGQAFTDSITGDWGGKPYQDLMKGLDHALAGYDFLDGERVAALGASYGGYMVNWIAGQTDRFRCLVNHDGVFDNRAMYYETEELWFPEWEHGGPAYASSGFAKHDPVAHVDAWTTPMLVVHGALDFRIPETQGFAAFTALQRKGVPSKLLYFPDENHWVSKPRNSILWHDTVIAWLDEWTGAGGQ